ncbi:MAG TPA: fatty acid desaturase [Coleofasciculaceae cyanobacterium]
MYKSYRQPQQTISKNLAAFIHTAVEPYTGIWVASTLLGLWVYSLIVLLSCDLTHVPAVWMGIAVLGRTFLHTGLFIIAHDAMHGTVLPQHRQINHWMGTIAISLYALLPYKKYFVKHWEHHRQPGQIGDPDYHDGIHSGIFAWYFKFMNGYLDARQKWVLLIGMTIIFHGLRLGFQVASLNLMLFWVLPIVLSSMQLFAFGTYLPHREQAIVQKKVERNNPHRAISSHYPIFWSFLTCYHFGYHWEHHEYPHLPWYRLPSARRSLSQSKVL